MLKNILAFGLLLCLCANSAKSDDNPQRCLDAHNYYRAQHGVPPLVLDPELQAFTEEKIKTFSAVVPFPPHPYGINWSLASYLSFTPENAVRSWHWGHIDHNWEDQEDSPYSNSFVQVVWKNTTKLGCAVRVYDYGYGEGEVAVLAFYDPKGAIPGEYEDNVFPMIE